MTSLSVYDFESDSEVSDRSFRDAEAILEDYEESLSSQASSSQTEPGVLSARSLFSSALSCEFHSPHFKSLKKSRASFAAKLLAREVPAGVHWTARRALTDWGVCKRVRIRDIVDNEGEMLRAGHIFMGFSQDGRYLLSYTTESRQQMISWGGLLLPSDQEEPSVKCTLHFWSSRPFKQATRIVHSAKLFQKVSSIGQNFKCVISQWLNDNSRLVVMAYWTTSNGRDSDSERHVALSIIAVPNSPEKTADVHMAPISSYSPVLPQISLIVDNLVILQCGELLLLYRFIKNGVRDDLEDVACFPRFPVGRKRPYADDDHSVQQENIHSDEKIPIPSADAVIWEAFLPSGSSYLISHDGRKQVGHALENILRHVGAPKLDPLESDLTIEMGTVRTDILVDAAWQSLKSLTGLTVHTRQTHFCLVESVSVLRQEITLKGCVFTDGLKRDRLRTRPLSFVFPFFLHVNYISGLCALRTNGIRTASNLGGYDTQTLFRIMDQAVQPLDAVRKKCELVRPVHTLNNFNVSREESLTSFLSPCGAVEINP